MILVEDLEAVFFKPDPRDIEQSKTEVIHGTSLCMVEKNPPANAGGHGFDPWFLKIPHAAEQQSPHTQLLKT